MHIVRIEPIIEHNFYRRDFMESIAMLIGLFYGEYETSLFSVLFRVIDLFVIKSWKNFTSST